LRREKNFEDQLDALTDAYMKWSLAHKEENAGFHAQTQNEVPPADSGSLEIKVVDVFSKIQCVTV
jgi:hypothetical protein